VIAILSLLIILTFSIIITRIATLALTQTGLSRQSARFQARSAFTGVGYTTSESEKIVNHPIRRRILFFMMLLGNAGIVTVISTFIIGFVRAEQETGFWIRVAVLITGLGILMTMASSRLVDRWLSKVIMRMLNRYTKLDVRDYAAMLHLGGEYSIHELYVNEEDWMAHQNLKDLDLKEEGILVLGITRREGTFIGTPSGETDIMPGDTLILYGRGDMVERLDRRHKGIGGELAHAEAVTEQKKVKEEQKKHEKK
jgi:hypothetical protein